MGRSYFTYPGHVLAAAIALSVLDLVIVGLRITTRRKQSQPLRMDDWLMVPATLLTVGIAITLIYGVAQESVAYPTEIPPEFADDPWGFVTDQNALTSKLEYAITLMYPLAIGCIKSSFLFFYMRVFVTQKSNDVAYKVLLGLNIFVGIWTVAFFFSQVFDCGTNFFAIWGTVRDLQTYCTDTLTLNTALVSSDLITDIMIIIVPIPLIWRLNLNRSRKIAASAVFLLGALSIGASMARAVIVIRVKINGFGEGVDEILGITELLYWALVECAIGILAASLPTLQFLLRFISWDAITSNTRSIMDTLISRRTGGSSRGGATDVESTGNATLQNKYSNSTLSSSRARNAQAHSAGSATNGETYQLQATGSRKDSRSTQGGTANRP